MRLVGHLQVSRRFRSEPRHPIWKICNPTSPIRAALLRPSRFRSPQRHHRCSLEKFPGLEPLTQTTRLDGPFRAQPPGRRNDYLARVRRRWRRSSRAARPDRHDMHGVKALHALVLFVRDRGKNRLVNRDSPNGQTQRERVLLFGHYGAQTFKVRQVSTSRQREVDI
jgi:hypothetical protein